MLTHAARAPIRSATETYAEVREEKEAEVSRLQRARIVRGLKFGIPVSLALWASILWVVFA